MPNFEPAPDAERIGRELIVECHPHLQHAKIVYLFTDKERKKANRVVLATAQKLSDLQKFLSSGENQTDAEADFIVIIGKDRWERMEDAQRKAVVDHELCHCKLGKNGWTVVGHDVEEFQAVIARHGLYKDDVAWFAKTIQAVLPFDIANRPVETVPVKSRSVGDHDATPTVGTTADGRLVDANGEVEAPKARRGRKGAT